MSEVKDQMPFEGAEKDSENLLVVKNLKKYFPIKSSFFKMNIGNVKAVDGVSFVIKKGTKTCGIAMWQKGSSELFMAWLVIAMLPRSAYRSEIKAMQNPIAKTVWKILR